MAASCEAKSIVNLAKNIIRVITFPGKPGNPEKRGSSVVNKNLEKHVDLITYQWKE